MHITLTRQRVKSVVLSNIDEDVKRRSTLNMVNGMRDVRHYLVNYRYLTYNPGISFPGIYPTETLTYVYQDTQINT